MLIVLGGLPGAGKTTIARALARRLGMVHLRIDTIEQAICDAGLAEHDIGAAGYTVAHAVAADNLSLGRSVVADSVNPCVESRDAWRRVAETADVPRLEIEITCSNEAEHRRRVETRVGDIPGHRLPDWSSVCRHDYEPRHDERLIIDTATQDVEAALALIGGAIGAEGWKGSSI